ncbi:MAG: MGMT family protein [Chlorobia bacterium]|nr:MGMT family protein [Fimbriimonadaceae bacterium]
MTESRLDELWTFVRSIPEGRVCGYGALGKAMRNPVSGLLIGRWMAVCPSDVPWWRVVAADGRLPVWKKDPNLEVIQHDRLAEEGVDFDLEGRVRMDGYRWEP